MNLEKVRYILWDVDGTLLNFELAEEAAINACFAAFDLGSCTAEMLERYKVINRSYWERLEKGEVTKQVVLEHRFIDFFGEYGLDTCVAADFNARYQMELGNTACFNPHGKEVVEALKGKYQQFAATNGTKVAQDRKLANSGLDKIFDGVFISEEVGFEKPTMSYYEAIYAATGCSDPEQYLMIGDSLTSDMQGGNNAGMPTVWFNPSGAENKSGLRIDFEIRDLGELAGILK